MIEFWEKSFNDKQEMWGFEPAQSAIIVKDFFASKGVQNVLIPGIGYGRNAQVFLNHGMSVTGIEISETAIKLARKHYGTKITIHHGSVTDMPFDNNQYDGVFCYALIHLLDKNERAKLIRNCYDQLVKGGCMFFTVVTKEAQMYGQGNKIDQDRFELFGGVKMFFYDRQTIRQEFRDAGLVEISEIVETYPFYLIKCKK